MANNKFIPVRGKQADIANYPKNDGYIYFAYDTGNVYIDKAVDGIINRYPVGSGASGIVYASGDGSSIFKMSVDDTDRNYRILISALPETEQVLPAPNSLIINSDGRFFRVKSVDSTTQTIYAVLLAVSGSGSGGGSGEGGEGPVATVNFRINSETLSSGMMFVQGQTWNVELTPHNSYDNYVTLNFVVTNNDNEIIFETTATRVPVE